MGDAKTLRQKRAEEYLRCLKDPKYFIQNYVYIVHQKRGLILFDLFDFQERVFNDLLNHKYNIVLKARQMGLTTLVSAYAVWLMTFHKNKEVLALSYKQDKAKNIVSKVKNMRAHLPAWMREGLEIDNQLAAKFENGSRIRAESTTKEAGRSESASLVIIDEAAFIDNAEEVWSAVNLTLDIGDGDCMVLSTPTGVGTWFHEMWQKAISGDDVKKTNSDPEVWAGEGENNFHPIKLHWSLHPERGQEWRDEQTETMGEKKAARECFGGDTKIYTDEGLVPIRDIEVGDRVLTHKGRFREVLRTFEKEDETLTFNTSLNKKKSHVTPDHPVLDLDEEWNPFESFGEGDKLSHFPSNVTNPRWEFISTFDVSDVDYSRRYSILEGEDKAWLSDKHKTKIESNIEIDYGFGYLVGLYLADGYKKKNNRRITFTHHKDDEWPDEIKEIIKDKFGISSFQSRKNAGKGRHLSVCNKLLSLVVDKFVKTGTGEEKGLSSFSYEMGSEDYFEGVLDGIMKGDGCLTNTTNKTLTNISPHVVDDVIFISSILGYPLVSRKFRLVKTEKIEGREVDCNSTQHVASFLDTKHESCNRITEAVGDGFRNENGRGHTYGNGEYSVCRVNEVEDGGQTTVYNLEVEEDHTYVTEHFVAHNCDCDFSTSGDTVIDQEIIKWYERNAVKDPMETQRSGKGDVWIWEPVQSDVVYLMASDVARGDAKDYSTFQIYKARSMEQVAEYKGKIPPSDFGDLLHTYGTMYNSALLIIERDSYGWAAMQRVIDRQYPNLLYTSNDLKLVEIDRDMASASDKNLKPGIDTNTNTRGLIISRLQEFMRNRWLRCKSQRFIDELHTFIWKNKGTRQKPEHMEGYNDDLVLAAAFACWVRDKALKYRAELMQRSKKSVSNIKGRKLAYSPRGSGGQDPYTQEVGGESQDLRWLLD